MCVVVQLQRLRRTCKYWVVYSHQSVEGSNCGIFSPIEKLVDGFLPGNIAGNLSDPLIFLEAIDISGRHNIAQDELLDGDIRFQKGFSQLVPQESAATLRRRMYISQCQINVL